MKKCEIRVFPRKTNMTPVDFGAYIGDPPGLFIPENIKINISVTFTYDLKEAERLSKEWGKYGPVEIGGPAIGMKGGEFIPGKYVKQGYVITSRGCRNRCWFCSVWRREGNIRELSIKEGNNILDDNLLACSDEHITKVFDMLKKQKGRKQFTGGLEAALLKEWHVKELKKIKPYQIFFAYDTPGDREPLFEAGKLLQRYGFRHQLRCYCLIGWESDTFKKAKERLIDCMKAGFMPMAMLYRNESGNIVDNMWKKFQREWARPAIMRVEMNKYKEAV